MMVMVMIDIYDNNDNSNDDNTEILPFVKKTTNNKLYVMRRHVMSKQNL